MEPTRESRIAERVPGERATAVVLAGGTSGRMGLDKSMMIVHGRPIIEHVCRQLHGHFDQVLISANETDKYAFLGLEVITDRIGGCGPLMGIASGVEASANDLNFVVACDIPEINIPIVRKMLRQADGYDIVMPTTGRRHYEPLFAVYRKTALPAMREVLSSGERKISKVFDRCRIRYVDLSTAKWLVNLNTVADYQAYAQQHCSPIEACETRPTHRS